MSAHKVKEALREASKHAWRTETMAKCINCNSKLEPLFSIGLQYPVFMCPLRRGKQISKFAIRIPCANCDESHKTKRFSNRYGVQIHLCTQTKAFKIRYVDGSVSHYEIMCNNTDSVTNPLKSFKRLTRESNLTLNDLVKATNETVEPATLLEMANLSIMLGIPANDLPTLFRSAYKLGLALGLEPRKAIESLAKGIGRQSKLILDNIGIAFNRSEAYEWYKQQKGLAKLPDTEKRDAWISYAIELVKRKAKEINGK